MKIKSTADDFESSRPNRFACRVEPTATADHTSVVTLGLLGTSTSHLHPNGTVCFGDANVNVVTEGGFIGYGVTVAVSKIEGSRIVVREV